MATCKVLNKPADPLFGVRQSPMSPRNGAQKRLSCGHGGAVKMIGEGAPADRPLMITATFLKHTLSTCGGAPSDSGARRPS